MYLLHWHLFVCVTDLLLQVYAIGFNFYDKWSNQPRMDSGVVMFRDLCVAFGTIQIVCVFT